MLKHRLGTSLIIIAVILAALFLPGLPGAVVFVAAGSGMVIAATLEFFSMTQRMGYRGYPKLTSSFAVILIVTTALSRCASSTAADFGHELETLVLLAFLLIGFFRVFYRKPAPGILIQHFVSIGGLIYVAWTLNFLGKIYFSSGLSTEGRWLAVFVLVTAKMGDVGAYAAGTLSAARPGENHKLARKLSPKKSWEGLAGGIVFSVAAALFVVSLNSGSMSFRGVPVLGTAGAWILGAVFPLIGLVGDLAESALKRASGLKDSGNLPGLGGALDILDSLILIAPVFYCYVRIGAVL